MIGETAATSPIICVRLRACHGTGFRIIRTIGRSFLTSCGATTRSPRPVSDTFSTGVSLRIVAISEDEGPKQMPMHLMDPQPPNTPATPRRSARAAYLTAHSTFLDIPSHINRNDTGQTSAGGTRAERSNGRRSAVSQVDSFWLNDVHAPRPSRNG